jgi:nucleoside-diphosphate-sugar epimerase
MGKKRRWRESVRTRPAAPVTPYAQTKLRGELLVQEWATRTGGVGVLLRLATVYGPRDRGNMARMMEAIRRGRFVLPGDGRNCKTCVAVETVAGVAANAGTRPNVPNGLPVVVADPYGAYSLAEIARGDGVGERHRTSGMFRAGCRSPFCLSALRQSKWSGEFFVRENRLPSLAGR